MKLLKIRKNVAAIMALAGAAALAGCGPKSLPPAPPPPAVVIPPQPQPPSGASANVPVPPIDAYGIRRTVNAGLSSAQTTWNLRSAYNVAALNCLQPRHGQIVEGYRAYLRANAKQLTAANRTVDQEFKARYGTKFIPPREAYMTQVYNYFALPPTLGAFCDAVLAVSLEAQTIKPAELDAFSARSLPALERVFLDFYRSYDQYRVDLAAWQARYVAGTGIRPGTQPITQPAIQLPASAQATAQVPLP